MYYPEETVDEVRQRNDIVDVISGYMQLKKKGASYFGLCPFHGEKTPSFSVSQSRQMFHCFGCGKSGNVFGFVMEYENLTFPEAVKMLADRAGIELPEAPESSEQRAFSDRRKTLLEINKLAASYYFRQLKQPAGKHGYEYLTGRGLSQETIRRFGLGYAKKQSGELYRLLKDRGYDDALLRDTGLFTYTDRGPYEKFWNRVMFPIMDVNNRVVGFGGRVMGDGEPKYLNSPETPVFDKSRTLYGLNYARLSRKREMLLCEGYMDVISMHQAGFTNAVASLGTAFTEKHAVILKRYADSVILTYDSDGAGVKAALRAIPMLRNVGLPARVLDMRPYKDPDEFIKNEGAEAFQQRIDNARNSFLFEIDVLRRGIDPSDPEQLTDFYHKTARKLLEFDEPLERMNYADAVSREFFIPKEQLVSLVNRLGLRYGTGTSGTGGGQETGAPKEADGRPAYRGPGESPGGGNASGGASYSGRKSRRKGEEGIRKSQRILLGWLIDDPSLFARIEGILEPEDFTDPLYRRAAAEIFRAHEADPDKPVDAAGILSRYGEDDGAGELALLFTEGMDQEEESPDSWAFAETVKRIKNNSLDEQIKKAGNMEEMQQLIKAKAHLSGLRI